jgi:hypothetical protein
LEVKCRNQIFEVFDKSEAEDLNIVFSDDWRNAKKGDWILTSDDKVLKVLNRRETTKKSHKKPIIFIRIGYGEVPTYKSGIFSREYKDWHWDNGHRYELVKDIKPTLKQSMFVDKLIAIGDIDKDGMWSYESIVNAYQSTYKDNNPTASLQRGLHILRKQRVKEHMSKLMKDKFDDIGVSDEYVAVKYKNFIEDEDISAGVRLNALNKVSELKGHTIKETQQIEGTSIFALSDKDKKVLKAASIKISDSQIQEFLQDGDENGTIRNKNTKSKNASNKIRHRKKNTGSSGSKTQSK